MDNKSLPAYLRAKVNAAPRPESIVVCGDTRLTVITPCLVRIEQGVWTDDATLTVIRRDFDTCVPTVTRTEQGTLIRTGMLDISVKDGLPLAQGLTIARTSAPMFVWHYGEKPLRNLLGTTSTLDNIDGECPLEDGVCSLDGFTVLDDSQTPRLLDDGWFAPREACTDVYFFGYGHDYTACVQDYYRLTGTPDMLPAFALGNWWSRYHAYTEEEYLSLMDQFHDKDVPLSVGIVDMDWHLTTGENRTYQEGWTGYTWNEKLFPDYKRFLRGIHERGLRTALNLHPALGVRSYEAQYADMAKAMGVDPASGKPIPFNCLDPQFLKAYFEVLHFPYEQDGVDFWWMDWQQGNDYAKIVGEDYKPSDLACITPLKMLNHMHYMASRRHGGRGMIFSRFSGYGSQRYPIGFSGDTFITWDSLRFQPYFTVTASNVGYGWWSHDIGGHMGGIRDDELTARWIQFGVFSPIFRLHSTDSVFLGREPWRYNKRAELVMEDFMRLRHRLFPYLYTMCYRNCQELLPLMRPMYHVHPECSEAYQVRNEYWFGSELMAAPITEPADHSDLAPTTVWFPEGVWTDAFTGFIYKGGRTLTVLRPMEQMPLFMKAGALIPMQAHAPHSRKLGGAEHMELYVAPGASGSFTLYEDDGESMAYAQGGFCTTALTLDWQEQEAVLTIAPVKGDQSLVPALRQWDVHFRGFRKGCSFRVKEQAVAAVYDAPTNTYTVTLTDVAASEGVTVTVTHADALLHDNSDDCDRAIDAIIRAQLPWRTKQLMHTKLEGSLKEIACGRPLTPNHLTGDGETNLGRYIYELLIQRQ
ncbi:MAG: TIM-barrel domain-containing protein [Aristaeellaceae bacterium]